MSRLLRLAQNNFADNFSNDFDNLFTDKSSTNKSSINESKNNFNNAQMDEIVKYINKEVAKILREYNSFLDLMSKINRLIININNMYDLDPQIKKFTIQEFAKTTFSGFESIYQQISTQNLDNLATNISKLKDINIDDDFNKLDANDRKKICNIIVNNIDTSLIQMEMLEALGIAFGDKVEEVIANDHWSYFISIKYDSFHTDSRTKRTKSLSSFLIAWIRTNQNNVIRKINNIIHNTVPITYDNYASYDDDINYNENGTDPNAWVTYSDEEDPIHDVRESNVAPMYFSTIRLSPLVVLDDEVLFSEDKEMHHNDLINDYKQKHHIDEQTTSLAYTDGPKSILEEFGAQNMAIGSLFQGKVALLEYITDGREQDIVDEHDLIRPNNGNPAAIIKSLQNRGIKKVYIQNVSPWVSREYERIASPKYNKFQRLMKKVLG